MIFIMTKQKGQCSSTSWCASTSCEHRRDASELFFLISPRSGVWHLVPNQEQPVGRTWSGRRAGSWFPWHGPNRLAHRGDHPSACPTSCLRSTEQLIYQNNFTCSRLALPVHSASCNTHLTLLIYIWLFFCLYFYSMKFWISSQFEKISFTSSSVILCCVNHIRPSMPVSRLKRSWPAWK